jgi:hypothetical protein
METALDKLKRMTAWDVEPELSEGDLEAILAECAVADAAGLPPSDEDWDPTYDMNAAAAKGWLVKAARASCLTEIDPPGSGVVTSQVFENCCEMARMFAARRKTSVGL